MAASTMSPCIPVHQQADFDCERSRWRLTGKGSASRRERCVHICLIAAALGIASTIGFFILGRFTNHATFDAALANYRGSRGLAKAVFMQPLPLARRPHSTCNGWKDWNMHIPSNLELPPARGRSTPRAPPAVAAGVGAVLERQLAPPAPPTWAGGGNGGSGEPKFHLRMLALGEQASIIKEWVHQTRIYARMGSFGGNKALARKHTSALKKFENLLEDLWYMRLCLVTPKGTGKRVLFGLFKGDQSVGVAKTAVVRNGIGVDVFIINMAVYPAGLNKEEVEASYKKRMLDGLKLIPEVRAIHREDDYSM